MLHDFIFSFFYQHFIFLSAAQFPSDAYRLQATSLTSEARHHQGIVIIIITIIKKSKSLPRQKNNLSAFLMDFVGQRSVRADTKTDGGGRRRTAETLG